MAQFAVLAQEKLKSVKAEINAIKRLGLARDVYEQKKAEAQELAELTVRAEVKLGEITSNMPTAQGARTDLTSLPQGKEVVTKQAALKMDIMDDTEQPASIRMKAAQTVLSTAAKQYELTQGAKIATTLFDELSL